MKLFFEYIHTRRKTIAAFFLFSLVFIVSFLLFRLPTMAALYPSAICFLLGTGFIVYDFCTVRKKHALLSEIRQLSSAASEHLPEPDHIEEADYQALIRTLKSALDETQAADSLKYREMIDYYTVWAHQIKTPISAMKLTLQNEDSPLSRRLSSELFRIEQYVEMVLAFLRLNSDSSDYVFRKYTLDDIIRPAVRKFASEFIDRKIRFEYTPISDTIITDEKWFSFVIEQLLSNALKYTMQGSIRIYLSAPKILCIADTGIGISLQDLPRVFEKGYTGYNGRTDKSASGLGLYLCKRVCRNLGLKISIASEYGKGTTVSIDLSQHEGKPE